MTFGATKAALNGLADALREIFRQLNLAVTVLQLGYLNTNDPLSTPLVDAVERSGDEQIPVHDVVEMVGALMRLSIASFVRELMMPAIRDERF